MRTALLNPGKHIGGMVSGGLSGTDVGRREVIGGLALEFYWRAGRYYELDRHLQEYEGDLMTQAKVSYTFGRESRAQYGEPLAGVRAVTPIHQFAVDIPAHDERGGSYQRFSRSLPDPGSADKRIQAYNSA